jgi:ankyrin repeat protein
MVGITGVLPSGGLIASLMWTALHCAAAAGQADIVDILLANRVGGILPITFCTTYEVFHMWPRGT